MIMPDTLKTSDFYYDLPEELIAQTPLEPRDSSRLLVYHREKKSIEHRIFRDITDYLKAGDVLVLNRTRVLPARLYARTEHGGAAEVLLLKRLDLREWEVLVRPGRKCRPGASYEGTFEDVLSRAGTMPLPPYIHEKLKDPDRYQTVYSKETGSAAAPTAGLHFTPELLERIRAMGVEIVEVLLHVGLGTFRPVKEENVLDHKMHSEHYEVSGEAAEKINAAKREGRRVVAVGTTSVRTLETVADEKGMLHACTGDTSIFLYPPYKMKCVDARSREEILDVYKTAVEEKYRFFSFGDAMLIV